MSGEQGGPQQGQQGGQQGQQQGQQQQGQQQQQAEWHGLTDPADLAVVNAKGWKSPADIVKAYKGAETLLGRSADSLLTMPKDGDEASWNATYDRLGRPKDAKGYNLKGGLPENSQIDEEFMGQVGDLFHKSGLTAKQAEKIAAGYNGMVIARQAQVDTDAAANVAADRLTLQKEWGGGHERMVVMAQTAVRELGFTEAEVSAMQEAVGYRGVMTKFAEIGKRLSDPNFVGSAPGTPRFNGTMTPAEAAAEIGNMKLNGEKMKALYEKFHPAHKEVSKQWQDLHKVAYPE